MPSRRHELLAYAVPRLRRSRDLGDRRDGSGPGSSDGTPAWIEASPPRSVRCFDKRFAGSRGALPGGFPSYTLTATQRLAGPDGRLCARRRVRGTDRPVPGEATPRGWPSALNAAVVMPDYPLTPEHSWRDSHEDVVALIQRATATSDRVVVAGDSAGGGIALAAALTVRDRGGPQPSHLLLHAPWVDLTTSTRARPRSSRSTDPWLMIGKMYAYASWWAGSEDDLGRPEVSPALADLGGLPRDADVLRHPRHPQPRLPSARSPRRRGRVGPHLRRAARTCCTSTRSCRSSPRPSRRGERPWSSSGEHRRSASFDDLDAATAYEMWRLRQQVFVVEQECAYPDLDGRDPEPRPGTCLEDRATATCSAMPGCSTRPATSEPGGSVGWRCTDRARPGLGRRAHGGGAGGHAWAATSSWTPRRRWSAGTRRSDSRSPDRSSSRTTSRTSRW